MKMRVMVVLAAASLTLLPVGRAFTFFPRTYTVKSTSDDGHDDAAGDGICQTSNGGVCTLRAAIEESNAHPGVDTIQFNIPTTDPGFDANAKTFTIKLLSALPNVAGVTINGPGPKKLIVQRALNAATKFPIFTVSASETITISGLTIAFGRNDFVGGGLVNQGSGTVAISNCIIRNNAALGGGGIANVNTGTLTLENSALLDNASENDGGAIQNTGPGHGTQGGPVVITGCEIRNNLARSGGGAILNADAPLTITNTTIADNRVAQVRDNDQAAGGGIWSSGSVVALTGCTISGNSAACHTANDANARDAYGGGIFSSDTTLNITNCTISGNTVEGSDSTVLAGGAAYGGGIYYRGAGTLNVSNSTVAANTATSGLSPLARIGSGGGLYHDVRGGVNVKSTIIANNSATTSGPDALGDFSSAGFNLIGKKLGSTGFNNATDRAGTVAAPLDPKLGPLQDNAGPTKTMALLAGSPAIDNGSSASLTAGTLATDQRGSGFARTFDNSSVANSGDGTDIGAFERQAP